VAEDRRCRVRQLAFDYVEVAMTDTAGRDFDQHFALARPGLWYILYNQRAAYALEDGSLHRSLLALTGAERDSNGRTDGIDANVSRSR
jgi:hypothetical protein